MNLMNFDEPEDEIEIEKGRGWSKRDGGSKGEERIRSKEMDSYTYQRINHISIHVGLQTHISLREETGVQTLVTLGTTTERQVTWPLHQRHSTIWYIERGKDRRTGRGCMTWSIFHSSYTQEMMVISLCYSLGTSWLWVTLSSKVWQVDRLCSNRSLKCLLNLCQCHW